jgi:hypothetical protein
MQSLPKRVRGFFYSGATTGKPSLRVRELFSTHDGCCATRSIYFFSFFFLNERCYATRSLFFTHRGILRNASYPVRFISRHISFFAGCGHPRKGRGTVACTLVASAYICVCPQLTWPAPPVQQWISCCTWIYLPFVYYVYLVFNSN